MTSIEDVDNWLTTMGERIDPGDRTAGAELREDELVDQQGIARPGARLNLATDGLDSKRVTRSSSHRCGCSDYVRPKGFEPPTF
ncbi:MAG TPA: hypothetical protein VGE11_16950 [Pseudonocardia sp.]